jgi:hypothetical protein
MSDQGSLPPCCRSNKDSNTRCYTLCPHCDKGGSDASSTLQGVLRSCERACDLAQTTAQQAPCKGAAQLAERQPRASKLVGHVLLDPHPAATYARCQQVCCCCGASVKVRQRACKCSCCYHGATLQRPSRGLPSRRVARPVCLRCRCCRCSASAAKDKHSSHAKTDAMAARVLAVASWQLLCYKHVS